MPPCKKLVPLTNLGELTPNQEVGSRLPIPQGRFGKRAIPIIVKAPSKNKKLLKIGEAEKRKKQKQQEEIVVGEMARLAMGKSQIIEEPKKRKGDDFDPWAIHNSSKKLQYYELSSKTRTTTTQISAHPTTPQYIMIAEAFSQLLEKVNQYVQIFVEPGLEAQETGEQQVAIDVETGERPTTSAKLAGQAEDVLAGADGSLPLTRETTPENLVLETSEGFNNAIPLTKLLKSKGGKVDNSGKSTESPISSPDLSPLSSEDVENPDEEVYNLNKDLQGLWCSHLWDKRTKERRSGAIKLIDYKVSFSGLPNAGCTAERLVNWSPPICVEDVVNSNLIPWAAGNCEKVE